MRRSRCIESLTAAFVLALSACSSPAETTQTGGSAGSGGGGSTSTGTVTAPPEGDATHAAVTAAQAFLATLTDAQRAAVSFSFDDGEPRTRWSNLPTGLFARNGVKLGDMTAAQKTTLFALLAAILGPAGDDQVMATMNADEALLQSSGGGNLIFGIAEYFVSIMGTPSATSPWRVQFGGHHLAIHATIVGGDMTLAPSLTGAQPASFSLDGETFRPQGVELDRAFELMGTLSAEQQSTAVIASSMPALAPGAHTLVLRNKHQPVRSSHQAHALARDEAVRIGKQRRDATPEELSVDFEVRGPPVTPGDRPGLSPLLRVAALLGGAVLLAGESLKKGAARRRAPSGSARPETSVALPAPRSGATRHVPSIRA